MSTFEPSPTVVYFGNLVTIMARPGLVKVRFLTYEYASVFISKTNRVNFSHSVNRSL